MSVGVFGGFMGGGKSRSLLHCHLGPKPRDFSNVIIYSFSLID